MCRADPVNMMTWKMFNSRLAEILTSVHRLRVRTLFLDQKFKDFKGHIFHFSRTFGEV